VILVYTNDPTHSADCIKNCYHNNDIITAKLDEPLSEKEKTFKAEVSVREIIGKNNEQDVKGSIIIYFQKDSSLSSIGYGSQIVFEKSLQLIKNAGNPGSFDYQRCCASRMSQRNHYAIPCLHLIIATVFFNFVQKKSF
jgi:competence protein ComEC